MKRIILIIQSLILISQVAYSQSNSELTKDYPEAQKEVKAVLQEIENSIRANDMDKLISFHAYGPKFTEYGSGAKRTGSGENEEFERGFLGSITEVEKWDWEDLKISVFGGDVANVTFHADFKFKINEDEHQMKEQGTLLFIKTDQGWKIVHEHFSPLNEVPVVEKHTENAKVMHISKDQFPKDNMINIVKDWGEMVVAINEVPAGTDFSPLLKGQKNDLCQVAHWGYLEKGSLKAIDKEGNSEVISAGEVFYMPPGHTAVVIEDLRIIEFSPQKEMLELMADIENIQKDN